MKKVRLSILVKDEKLLPHYATEQSAGADLKAAIDEAVLIQPGESKLIPTGIRVSIPDGFEIQIRPRSGLALKEQITVLNTPGTIDADYRGEIGVILINHGKKPFSVTPGMRVAQMVLAPVYQAAFFLEEELSASARGEGGFGHSGLN